MATLPIPVLIPAAAAKRPKMSERAQQQQQLHFPNWSPLWLWQRKVHRGYTTVPRTLPYAMQAIDDQSKGQPAGHTLFCLWARSPDHPLLIIENPATLAAEAGFSGERAVDTWRRRMKRLQELCFIVAKKGPAGEFTYVLLQNPNVAMELMRQNGLVQDELYSRFLVRLTDVGGFGEIEAIRAFWAAQHAEQAKAAAQAAAAQANPGASATPPTPALAPEAPAPTGSTEAAS
jgi:hypothetical protein